MLTVFFYTLNPRSHSQSITQPFFPIPARRYHHVFLLIKALNICRNRRRGFSSHPSENNKNSKSNYRY